MRILFHTSRSRGRGGFVHEPCCRRPYCRWMGNAAGAGADEYRPPITPFGGWVADQRTSRLRPLETAPHIGAFAPPGTGKTRKWLAQSAVLWPGPALVSSSKDDLMQMVAARRYGPSALLDLRPIAAPYYPSDC